MTLILLSGKCMEWLWIIYTNVDNDLTDIDKEEGTRFS
jgi:hypothetical protein